MKQSRIVSRRIINVFPCVPDVGHHTRDHRRPQDIHVDRVLLQVRGHLVQRSDVEEQDAEVIPCQQDQVHRILHRHLKLLSTHSKELKFTHIMF